MPYSQPGTGQKYENFCFLLGGGSRKAAFLLRGDVWGVGGMGRAVKVVTGLMSEMGPGTGVGKWAGLGCKVGVSLPNLDNQSFSFSVLWRILSEIRSPWDSRAKFIEDSEFRKISEFRELRSEPSSKFGKVEFFLGVKLSKLGVVSFSGGILSEI